MARDLHLTWPYNQGRWQQLIEGMLFLEPSLWTVNPGKVPFLNTAMFVGGYHRDRCYLVFIRNGTISAIFEYTVQYPKALRLRSLPRT